MAATYTAERKAFGKFLHEFGMIKKKLARMAAEIVLHDRHFPEVMDEDPRERRLA